MIKTVEEGVARFKEALKQIAKSNVGDPWVELLNSTKISAMAALLNLSEGELERLKMEVKIELMEAAERRGSEDD